MIGSGTTGFAQSKSGNSLILTWSGLGIGSTGDSFSLEYSVSYTPGTSSFQRGYKVTAAADNDYPLENVQLAYGGDAYFGGSDSGYSYAAWNDYVHMAYLQHTNTAGSSCMYLSSPSAARYYAGQYNEGANWAKTFSKSSVATNTSTDNGYYLQWDIGAVGVGGSYYVSATEGIGKSGTAARIYAPDPGNAISNVAGVSQIVPNTDFLLVNLSSAVASATQLAVGMTSSIGETGITARYLGDSSYTLAANANHVLPVQVVVPPNTPEQTVVVTLSGRDSAEQSISASFTFTVRDGSTDSLPQISGEQASGGSLRFVLRNADSYRVVKPDGSSVIGSGSWDSANTTPVSLPISVPGEYSIYAFKTTDGITNGVFKAVTVQAINPTVSLTKDGTAATIESVAPGLTGLALSADGVVFYDMTYSAGSLYTLPTGLLDGTYAVYGRTTEGNYTRIGSYTATGADPEVSLPYVTVVFDGNGGICSVLSKAVRTGDVYGALPTPELDGRVFQGWYLPDGTAVTETSTVTQTNAHALYAMWNTQSHTVTNGTAENCTISNADTVSDGGAYPFSVTLHAGYSADSLVVSANGVRLTPTSVSGNVLNYTIYRVSCDQTISAVGAKKISFPVTLPQGEGYSAAGAGTVDYGQSYRFTVTVHSDYSESIPVVTNGDTTLAPVSAGNGVYTYELEAVTSAPAIRVSGIAQITQYSVTFTSNNALYAVQYIENGGVASAPVAPERTGYTFGGWQLNGAAYNFATHVTGDIALSALWNPVAAVITYHNDGGTAIAPVESTYGATLVLPVAEGLAGSSFVGWADSAQNLAAGIASWAGGSQYGVTVNADLYAVWTDLVLPVSLPVGRGYLAVGAGSVAYGQDYTFTVTVLDGYTQSTPVVKNNGTPLTPTGENPYTYTVPAVSVAPVITVDGVHAIPLWTVTCMSDGRTYAKQVVENNAVCPMPADPFRQGAVFAGWRNGADDYDFSAPVTADLTLTAAWTPLSYTVTAPARVENGAYAYLSGLNAANRVDYGGDYTFTITPDEGFSGENMVVAVNGTVLTGTPDNGVYRYVIRHIVCDQTVTVYGIDRVFDVSLPVGRGYSMTCTGNGSVALGGSYTFVLVLLDGYDQSDFTVFNNGTPVPPDGGNPYVFTLFQVTEQPRITITGVTPNPKWDVDFQSEGQVYTTQYVTNDSLAIRPVDPLREGYDFDGWYLGTEEYDFSTPVTGDITLTARWTIRTFTVTETVEANGSFAYVSGLNANNRVDYGSAYVFTVTPDPGFSMADVQVSANGIVLGGTGINGTFSFRIASVTSDTVIQVRNIHDIVPEVTLNRRSGSGIIGFEYKINNAEYFIAYTGRFCVGYGDRLEIRAILEDGYCIDQWTTGLGGNSIVIDSVETNLNYTPTTTGCVVTVDVSDMDTDSLGGAIWIDGEQYADAIDDNGIGSAVVTGRVAKFVTVYSYAEPANGDRRGLYPTGMRVWELEYNTLAHTYTATRIPEFENLLTYCGCSIRIKGVKGIRMITGITEANRNSLMGAGLAGFTLREYGTVLAWAKENNDPVLTDTGIMTNYAYNKATGEDPLFSRTNGIIQFTNVLVGFDDAQCRPDLVLRPYIKLADSEGNVFTLYGAVVQRSIGYIAYQNHSSFGAGSAAYEYVWGIIHSVYGDTYDALYTH